MSEKKTDDELSVDEMKKISGGIRAQGGGYKKANSNSSSQEMDLGEGDKPLQWTINGWHIET